MDSRRLVDPELLGPVDAYPTIPLTLDMLPAARAAIEQACPPGSLASNDDVWVEQCRIPGPVDGLPVRTLIYSPRRVAGFLPALLHIHGGGFVLGTPEMSDARNREVALKVGCVVVSVDYRLAPENPFPAGLEDCYAALRWLHANAARLNVDARRIAIGGESAGGGLCASLALLARDRGEVELVYQVLIYPTIDDRLAMEIDPHPNTGEFMWLRASDAMAWSALLTNSTAARTFIDAYAAPARAADLAGLPPAYIGVGALDLTLEQDMEYARRLTRAGVPVTLCVYPGAYHGFDMVGEATVTKNFIRDYTDALRRAFLRR
jgi:acetyl esterase/lipase